jgi:hypothetical protein
VHATAYRHAKVFFYVDSLREDSILRGFACKPTFHRVGVHQTGLLELKATASEYGEVRNSLDVVSRGKLREPFCVDFMHHGSTREVPRQGPHQAAQKSTSTGTLLSRTTSSNSSGPTSMGSVIAGSAALQAPHLPMSRRCFAGIRFGFPQDRQFRIMAMVGSCTRCHVIQQMQHHRQPHLIYSST